MQAQLENFIPVDSTAARERIHSFETLSRLDAAQCEAMFADAEAFPFDSLVGHPRGRVLAVPGRDQGAVGALLRALHASPAP